MEIPNFDPMFHSTLFFKFIESGIYFLKGRIPRVTYSALLYIRRRHNTTIFAISQYSFKFLFIFENLNLKSFTVTVSHLIDDVLYVYYFFSWINFTVIRRIYQKIRTKRWWEGFSFFSLPVKKIYLMIPGKARYGTPARQSR